MHIKHFDYYECIIVYVASIEEKIYENISNESIERLALAFCQFSQKDIETQCNNLLQWQRNHRLRSLL